MSQLYLNDDNQEKFDELFNKSNFKSKTDFVNDLLLKYDSIGSIDTDNESIEPIETESNTLNSIMNPIVNGSDNDIDILLNDDNIMKMSDLDSNTISTLSKAKLYADKYDSDTLKQYIDNYLKFSVSKSRKGRGELVDSFKATILEPLGFGIENLMGDNDDK